MKGGRINSQNMHTLKKNSNEDKRIYTVKRTTNHSHAKKKATPVSSDQDCLPWETLRPYGLDDD